MTKTPSSEESKFRLTISHFLQEKDCIYWVLGINLLLRLIIALSTNLGNDEVYYVTYALYPAWGYFDHPPLVGDLIRLVTFNLAFINSEFFVRLGSLLLGTLNLYLVYRIGILIKDKLTGIIAAVLLSGSFYSSIIVGTFILPDTPQSSLWLLSIIFFIRYISGGNKSHYWLILFGTSVGFALLAKYHAVYLWIGAILYFIIYGRKTLLNPRLWFSAFISGIIFLPVILWNLTSKYSGLRYHFGRVGNAACRPSLHYFFPEFFGQIFYNNPFNVYLIVVSLIFLVKKRKTPILDQKIGFLLCISLPLVFTILTMALFNRTLPHWSGPSYYALTLITASVFRIKDPGLKSKKLVRVMTYAQLFFFVVVVIALLQVKTGILIGNPDLANEKLGKDDFSIDLSMWNEISAVIKSEIRHDVEKYVMNKDHVILTNNWFPGSHLDYYFALPNNTNLYVLGKSNNQHNYMVINHRRGEIALGSNAYYITSSHSFSPPDEDLSHHFEKVKGPDIIPIFKNHKKRVNVFLWRMIKLKSKININPTDKRR